MLVVFLSLLTIEACGSGSASPPQPAIGSAFAREAVVLCQAALAQKKAEGSFPYPDFNPTRPDPSKLPGVAEYLLKTIDTFETWLQQMQALGEPPTGQTAWADLLDAIATHVRLDIEQQAAAQRSDTQTFINDYRQGTKAQDALLSAANKAGVPQCAAVDR